MPDARPWSVEKKVMIVSFLLQHGEIDLVRDKKRLIRKPKGVVTEFKNLADGVTGVMLRLEIQEKKSDMADKDWSALPTGTAWLLQLCVGSHRIVRADSAFTSTTAAVMLGK